KCFASSFDSEHFVVFIFDKIMTELCVLFVVKTGGVFAVESANVIALGQNILVVQITDKLRFFFIANQTSSPTSKRFVVTDIINQSWININLLSQICTFTYKFFVGCVKHDWNGRSLYAILIKIIQFLVGMVGGNHKNRIVEPRLFLGFFEKSSESIIGVTYTLMYQQISFRKLTFIFCWNLKRLV